MADPIPVKLRRKDRAVYDRSEIEAIIHKADVCRIAFADDNLPYIVAMNFGYRSGPPDSLYFHCANTGRKIDLIKKNNVVCFQMDIDHELVPGNIACDYTMTFQSVVGYGRLYIVTDPNEKIEGLNILMGQYEEEKEWTYDQSMLKRTTVLRCDIDRLSAKRKAEL